MKPTRTIIGLSLLCGLLIWIFDAIMDYAFYYPGTFVGLLITNVPGHEIYVRIVALVVLLVFGIILSRVFSSLSEAHSRAETERKRAETYLELAPVIFVALDETGEVILANRTTCEVLGYREDEILGQDWFENFLPDEVREKTRKVFRHLMQGNIQGYEYVEQPVRTYDGQERIIQWHNTTLTNESGTTNGVLSCGVDVTDLRNREKELEALHERWRQVVNQAPLPIMVHAEDGQVVTINDVWSELTGYELEEIPTIDAWTKKAYGVRKNDVKKDIHALYSLGERRDEGEYEVICKDGTRRVWEFSSAPLGKGEQGRRLVVSMARDVTEKKQAQRRLLRVNSLLRAVRNVNQSIVQEHHTPELLQCVCDELANARGYNSAWAALTAGDATHAEIACDEELKGSFEKLRQQMKHGDLPGCARQSLSEPERVHVIDQVSTCGDCPLAYEIEEGVRMSVAIKSSGNVFGVLSVALPQEKQPDQEELGLLHEVAGDLGLAMRGIAEEEKRHRAEKARRRSERKFRGLANSAPAVICTLKPDGTVEFVNQYVEEISGYKPDDLTGKNWWNIFLPGELSGHVDQLMDAFEKGDVRDYEMPLKTEEGDVRTMSWNSFNEWNDDGTLHRIKGIGIDVTERDHTRHQLENAKNRLEETLERLQRAQQQVVEQERDRALTQMASGIAHDFNNALSTVRGFTDLLLEAPEKREDEETLLKYLHLIDKATTRASDTVRRMRKFYRPREETVLVSLDINETVEEAISMTRPRWKDQAEAEGAAITVEQDLSEVPPVKGNESELHEMLTNLIFNAIDAMPEGGTLRFHTRQEENYVLIEVSDNGRGMDEEVIQHCWEPFYTTKVQTGTGLGLSVIKGIVNRHEGSIEVSSEPGEGATFQIYLPVAEDTRDVKDKRPLSAEAVDTLAVLVVEDVPEQRQLLTEYLQAEGHRVDTASDGKEGMDAFAAGSYDLVITDRAMPQASGDDVAAVVKKQDADMPVIMLSGFGDMMDAAGEKPDSVDLLVSKPVTRKDMREAIARVLGNSRE